MPLVSVKIKKTTRAKTAYEAKAGSLFHIDRWSPTNRERCWLLMSGASDPPKDVEISNRRPRIKQSALSSIRDGHYLYGVPEDLKNMYKAIPEEEDAKSVLKLTMTKKDVREHIQEFFQKCQREDKKPMLYYTGHGQKKTGNWCCSDGTITIEEIFGRIPKGMEYPTIISDSCYSGRWANFCLAENIGGFGCLSASREDEQAYDAGNIFIKDVREPYASSCGVPTQTFFKKTRNNLFALL